MTAANLKVGCCGFPLPKIEYAGQFPVVEVQQTFYQPPRPATLARWRAAMPAEFEFTLKAWQLITHTCKSPTYRRLRAKLTASELAQGGNFQWSPVVQQAWQTTFDCAEALGARHVLFQCPASFTSTADNLARLRRFFTRIERRKLTLIWEPRGPWPAELVSALCQELALVHAVDPFLTRTVTPDFIYFRLHGGKDFSHVFSDAELAAVAGSIPTGKQAYVMFNNRNMLADAKRFQAQDRPKARTT